MKLRHLAQAVGTAFVLMAGTSAALAQNYPSKPIELYVNYSAGGGTDLSFRVFAQFLQGVLGQPVVVVNKPGAGGVIGATALAKVRPDGYTIGNLNLPALDASFASKTLPMDPRKAFVPLGHVMFDPAVIAVSAKSKFSSLGDVISHLKANPSGASYAATGKVSTDGLTALAIEKAANVKFRIVNFEGGKDAITAALGGHVDAVGLTISEALPYVKDGSIKLLGVGGTTRNPDVPDVPTFAEQGFPLMINGSSRGLIIPAGTPDDVVKELREAVKKAAADPAYAAKAKELGLQPTYVAPEDVAKHMNEEIAWLQSALQD
ncbi:Bug family tripartite tricarboxylate transporter substrate binding protein [Microvirga massiliensis]|uniref:Bug family tripartite tricarboxylate transporter substrate binding protein n=1 Tax=Microvirga massiliensis TaxID=1033741 RepID=UPI00062B8856|nr:tripartite tricarboxylate transporter substrate binding protein [Microvirga massiliensis]